MLIYGKVETLEVGLNGLWQLGCGVTGVWSSQVDPGTTSRFDPKFSGDAANSMILMGQRQKKCTGNCDEMTHVVHLHGSVAMHVNTSV